MTRNRSLLLLILVACVVLPMGWIVFSGDAGCARTAQSDDEQEQTEAEKRKEEELGKEKEKPDFEPMRLTILPGMLPLDSNYDEDFDGDIAAEAMDGTEEEGDDSQTPRRAAAKPGHWIHARYQSKANNFDFSGRLTVECTDSSLNPIDLEHSPFRSSASRPIVLPKGQFKSAELPVFISVPTSASKRSVQMHAMLSPRGGRDVLQDFTPTLRLKPYQYHMVVLAGDPDRYGYLRSLDAIKPPHDDWVMEGLQEDYVVTLHGVDRSESLLVPSNPLAWTSIAYVIWDDMVPDALAPDQQSAMLDWLNWGGQLILSGPQTLDPLRASFLSDYLPATSDRTEVATPQMLAPINRRWSLNPKQTELDRSMYQLTSGEKRPLEITPLEPTAGSFAVPNTGGLVVERRVGRGRVVVTAFSLADKRVVNWQNFDGFFNSCLLRRPARTYGLSAERFPNVVWAGFPLRHDARINCGLRYFRRDITIPGEGRVSRVKLDRSASGPPLSPTSEISRSEEGESEERTASEKEREELWGLDWNASSSLSKRRGNQGYRDDSVAGVAGWSDFSAASVAARQSLQTASGISVPDADFVAKVLAGYLLCLVPLNWLFFKLLRRVEWAWFAAPVIAFAGAIGVIRLAQLDIGFVRSRTEISVLETQPGYHRGHLTRYCGLYTSLTSDYSVEFEDSNAVGLPFSTNPSREQLRLQKQKGKAVPFVRDSKVALTGYPVLSNSTGMVHVEQMVELSGQLELIRSDREAPLAVRNGMDWEVKGAIAVYVGKEGVRMAPLGDLASGAEVTVPDVPFGSSRALLNQLQQDPATSSTVVQGEVSLRELIRLAVHPGSLALGGWRVVGWTDQPVPGMEITPEANQNLFRTLLVCHLDHGPFPETAVDNNHAVDFQRDGLEEELDLGLGVDGAVSGG